MAASAAGLILAAAGITAANEVIFIPANTGKPLWDDFNWRLVPATAVAVLSLTALEKLSPPLAVGLAGMALFSVIFIPLGNAPSPVDNLSKMIGLKKK